MLPPWLRLKPQRKSDVLSSLAEGPDSDALLNIAQRSATTKDNDQYFRSTCLHKTSAIGALHMNACIKERFAGQILAQQCDLCATCQNSLNRLH